jgi:hypothetical protein
MVKALTNTRKGEKMKNQKVRVVIVKALMKVFFMDYHLTKNRRKKEKNNG